MSVWTVDRPAQNALGRITIELSCVGDQVEALRVKADTRCGRVLCSWNWSEQAEQVGDALVAVFFTFSATRTMRLNLDDGRLSVFVDNQYNQTDRPSDTLTAQMTRQ
ncbi:MAG: hypothetical protein AAF739_10010 [Pseudomonadota bacterium]